LSTITLNKNANWHDRFHHGPYFAEVDEVVPALRPLGEVEELTPGHRRPDPQMRCNPERQIPRFRRRRS